MQVTNTARLDIAFDQYAIAVAMQDGMHSAVVQYAVCSGYKWVMLKKGGHKCTMLVGGIRERRGILV
jgi:hypothetical protein